MINELNSLDIPEEIIIQAIKDISDTELNYMSEVCGYLEMFFTDNEERVNALFTKEDQDKFDSYVKDYGENIVVAHLIKIILEKL